MCRLWNKGCLNVLEFVLQILLCTLCLSFLGCRFPLVANVLSSSSFSSSNFVTIALSPFPFSCSFFGDRAFSPMPLFSPWCLWFFHSCEPLSRLPLQAPLYHRSFPSMKPFYPMSSFFTLLPLCFPFYHCSIFMPLISFSLSVAFSPLASCVSLCHRSFPFIIIPFLEASSPMCHHSLPSAITLSLYQYPLFLHCSFPFAIMCSHFPSLSPFCHWSFPCAIAFSPLPLRTLPPLPSLHVAN